MFGLFFNLVFIVFFISVFLTLIEEAKKQKIKKENKEDEEQLVSNNNIFSKQEQAKMMKDLKMEHWDGPYSEDDFEVKKTTRTKNFVDEESVTNSHYDRSFPEDSFETSDSLERKRFESSPVKEEKKNIRLNKRETLLFAMIDEPRCRKGKTR